MEGYCVRCNTRRTMVDAQPTTTRTGRPAVSGTCGVCGTRIFKMGRYEPMPADSPTSPSHTEHQHTEQGHNVSLDLERHGNILLIAAAFLVAATILLNWLRRD